MAYLSVVKEWQTNMLTLVKKIKENFSQVVEKNSRAETIGLFLLNHVEVQIKMGQQIDKMEMDNVVAELTKTVEGVQGCEGEVELILKDINLLAKVFSEQPHDKPGGIPHIALIGETGSGKSTLGNLFLDDEDDETFPTSPSVSGCTHEVAISRGKFINSETEVVVVDCPGLNESVDSDIAHLEGIVETLKTNLQYITTFVLVFNAALPRLTRTHYRMIEIFQAVFGVDIFRNAVVFFTHWPLDKRSEERRKSQKDSMPRKAKEMKELLKERFDLDFDVPCFFIDSIDIRLDMNVKEHKKSLKNFLSCISELIPYSTVNIAELEEKTEELKGFIDHQEPLLQKLGIEADRKDTYQPDTSDIKVGQVKRSIVSQNKFKNKILQWKRISELIKKALDLVALVENIIPEPFCVIIRSGRFILKVVVAGVDAVTTFVEKSIE